jgi:hypothetical protein
MEIFIKGNGKMVWPTDKVLSVILRVVFMKENGMKINSMVKEQNTGIIIKSNMKEISLKGKKQVEVNLNVKEVLTLEILLMVSSTDKAHTILQILVRYIKVVLFKINPMEKEKWHGQIKVNTLEILKME